MSPEFTNFLLVIGVLLAGAGMIAQGLSTFGVYRSVKRLREQIEPVVPTAQAAIESANTALRQAAATLEQAQAALTETRRQVSLIGQQSSQVLDLAMAQLNHFDQAREETMGRVRAQAERLELVMDDTLGRFQDVMQSMHRGVMRPVREVTGILAGIRAGLQTFRQGGRPSVADATNDDGMFI